MRKQAGRIHEFCHRIASRSKIILKSGYTRFIAIEGLTKQYFASKYIFLIDKSSLFNYNANVDKQPALIAQLDRAFGYGPKGWEFESLWVHQKSNRFSVAFLFDDYTVLSNTDFISRQFFCHIAYISTFLLVPFSILVRTSLDLS